MIEERPQGRAPRSIHGPLGEGLVMRIEEALKKAIRQVRDGRTKRATVSLAFNVEEDPEGEVKVEYTHKDTRTEKMSWHADTGPCLPLED